jgi:hypothetical protein
MITTPIVSGEPGQAPGVAPQSSADGTLPNLRTDGVRRPVVAASGRAALTEMAWG